MMTLQPIQTMHPRRLGRRLSKTMKWIKKKGKKKETCAVKKRPERHRCLLLLVVKNDIEWFGMPDAPISRFMCMQFYECLKMLQ